MENEELLQELEEMEVKVKVRNIKIGWWSNFKNEYQNMNLGIEQACIGVDIFYIYTRYIYIISIFTSFNAGLHGSQSFFPFKILKATYKLKEE